jgi:hypothetical protein
MERGDWMNEWVRQEIKDLQQTHGFEADEAVAFWHLQEAGTLMNKMRQPDLLKELARQDSRSDQEAPQAVEQQLVLANHLAQWHSRVSQHFAALNRALGERVLRRDYPDGWGRQYRVEDAEEG